MVTTVTQRVEELSGIDLPGDALDCGTETLVVDEAHEIVCQLTDLTGAIFETTVTFKELDTDSPSIDFAVDTEA